MKGHGIIEFAMLLVFILAIGLIFVVLSGLLLGRDIIQEIYYVLHPVLIPTAMPMEEPESPRHYDNFATRCPLPDN